LEANVLIKGFGKLVLSSLLGEELLETPLLLGRGIRELSVTRMRWKSGNI